MFDELKTKSPYITEEQWDLIEKGEASYIDFFNDEDMKAHQDAILEAEEAKRAAQIQAIIDGLKATEQTPESKMLVAQAMGEAELGRENMKTFMGVDKYIDHSFRHSFIQYLPFRGLRAYVDGYTDADGVSNPGYNLRFVYQHESGLQFIKYIPGSGPTPKNTEWALITQY